MSLIVGAYPAQGSGTQQQQFFEELGRIPLIRGLELPFRAEGGDSWPAGAPAAWSAVVTSIPGTMQRSVLDKSFGLASGDPGGRRAALDFVAGMRDYVAALADSGHRVEAVELHSAPPLCASSDAFAESLRVVLDWDWHGAGILVEHCDAPRLGSAPEKGFLSFEAEVQAVRRLRDEGRTGVAVLVNWARSVIETGQSRTAADHLRYAREAGVLGGVMFSGCAPVPTEFGYPWIDAHLPAVEVQGAPVSSLLNGAEIARCLRVAGDVPITGFKIGLPQDAVTASERVERLRQMCSLVTGAARASGDTGRP